MSNIKTNPHWEVINQEGDVYFFEGLEEHVNELKGIEDIGTGSTALCSDSAKVLRYNAQTGWYDWDTNQPL